MRQFAPVLPAVLPVELEGDLTEPPELIAIEQLPETEVRKATAEVEDTQQIQGERQAQDMDRRVLLAWAARESAGLNHTEVQPKAVAEEPVGMAAVQEERMNILAGGQPEEEAVHHTRTRRYAAM